MVDSTTTLRDLPPLTQADEDRLAALAARPDSQIDLGDLPELGPEDWKNAVRGALLARKGLSIAVFSKFRKNV